MFSGLNDAAIIVHDQLISIYWILLTPVLVVNVACQFLKARGAAVDPADILRRVIVSVVLLFSVKMIFNGVADVSDLITKAISQDNNVWDFIKKLGPNYAEAESSGEWFDLKEHAIYIISLLCYLVAYLGFFVSEALVAFVWTVLYAVSPLMILAYISRGTSSVTANLYRSLVMVAIWRILFAALGALLLNVRFDSASMGLDDWLLTAVLNLCIGLSMLLIPLFTKSLISDGLSQAATSLAAGVTFATAGVAKAVAAKTGKKAVQAGVFVAKPVTNPVIGNVKLMQQRLDQRYRVSEKVKGAKQRWEEMNLPRELKTEDQPQWSQPPLLDESERR